MCGAQREGEGREGQPGREDKEEQRKEGREERKDRGPQGGVALSGTPLHSPTQAV